MNTSVFSPTSTTSPIGRRIDSILEKGGMNSRDIANIFSIRPETVSRWNQGKAFPQRDTEQGILDLEFIVDMLSEIYEPDEARLWLMSRQRTMGNQRPAELIGDGRIEEVITAVHQLRDGAYL